MVKPEFHQKYFPIFLVPTQLTEAAISTYDYKLENTITVKKFKCKF